MLLKIDPRMQLKKSLQLLLAIGLIFTFLSCKTAKKKYVIPEKKFVEVLVDIHLADGIALVSPFPSTRPSFDSSSLYGSVFTKHNITRTEFDSSMAYYSRRTEKLQIIYTKVNAYLNKIESELAKGDQQSETEKNLLIWQDNKTYVLPQMGATNKIEIILPVSKPGFYTVSSKIKLYDDDQTVAPRMTLFFWYDNGTPKGFREYFRNSPIVKDGKQASYSASFKLTSPRITHLKGYILDHSNPDTVFTKHAIVSEIKVFFRE
jgi:hypothetical protein